MNQVYVTTMGAHANVLEDDGAYLYVRYADGPLAGKEAFVSHRYVMDNITR